VYAAVKTFGGSEHIRTGLLAIVITALTVAVGQSFTSVPMLFATPIYYAQFADTGGLNIGDKVRIAGVEVGLVRSTELDTGGNVVIGYTLGTNIIGTDSRAAVRTDTILGRKDLEIQPRGSHVLRANQMLPLGQTTTPYNISDALSDITKTASGWDTQTVKRSLAVLSQTLDRTSPHLSAALQGVQQFSEIIAGRDAQLKQLLTNANTIAGILGGRGQQINQLLVNAKELLATVNARHQELSVLLERVSAFCEQVQGVINDNPELHDVLDQLRVISDVLNQRRNDLADVLTTLNTFAASLAEALASGPYFKFILANLLPYQVLQPWVDAAFKKRGIDPEQFWRSAGLPAFRFPDPNGTRFSNGAPPAAPTPLEGTPDHPGPAVPPGSPCSYTPPMDGLPAPNHPLPCSGLTVGPYGDNPDGANYPSPDVVTSPPRTTRPTVQPGIPIAGAPGRPPPPVPGIPAPLPAAPPGARMEPMGPSPAIHPPPGTPPIGASDIGGS
jgi:phospholipid/cholesterol/gamma-HCH transport system substrate-binding protein